MIFQHIGDSIFITDGKGTIMLASHSAAELLKVADEAIVGQDLTTFLGTENQSNWEAITAEQIRQDSDGPIAIFESSLPRGDGTQTPLEWTMARFRVGSEFFFIGVARDLSDRIAAEQQRYEAEQMKTLLEIAGGAAHEINQPLTAILGYAEMSLAQLQEGDPLHTHQKHIAEAALRITEIVKRMQALREYRTRPYANGQRIVDFRPDDERRKEE
jgi:PAS domain S-box-containing protein